MIGPNDHRFLRAARTEAWSRQSGRCFWCLSAIARDKVTAEHLHAKAHGGSDQATNIAAACRPCNAARGSLGAARFRSMLHGTAPKHRMAIRERRVIFRVNRRADLACRRILKSVGLVP